VKNYAAAVERQVAPLLLKTDRDFFTKQLLAIPAPKMTPSYRAILVDPGGNLWIVASALGDEHTLIQIVDPIKSRIGQVDFPFEMEVLEVGSRFILGWYVDRQDLPHVVLYRYARLTQ
jgi:hypothetical protein